MSNRYAALVQQYPEFETLFANADHIDVKTVTGEANLRAFLANMMSYQPGWVTFLYGVRAVFVRFLGMKQKGMPRPTRLPVDKVPMQPGQYLSFFKVRMAEEDRYWVGEADDQHLKAALGVIARPAPGDQKQFHLITVVHYHNWAGPVYFNVIRPFHHLVVNGMMRAAIKQ